MNDWVFFRRVLIVSGVIAFAVLIWHLSFAFLLFFAAVLIAVLLSGAANFFTDHTPLSRVQALTLTIVLIVGMLAGVLILFGAQIGAQLTDVAQRLPAAMDNLEQRFGLGDVSGKLFEQMQSNTGALLFQITSAAGVVLNILANALLVLIAAVFLAVDPDLYRRGALKLVPPEQRETVGETVLYSGAALKQWLLGQLIAMAIVGTMTGVGLWLVGLPSPAALGLIAALAEFVPIVGPILGAIPAILLAMTVDTETLMWTIGVIIFIQQLESNMIMPLIQQRMVSLAPVVTIFAVLCFGLLFGPLGLLLATPMAVVTQVLVTRLYIRELLEEPAQVPGEKEAAEEHAKQRAARR